MIKINISGMVTCTFHEFKERYGDHKELQKFSEEKRETWLKAQYTKLYRPEEKKEEKKPKNR